MTQLLNTLKSYIILSIGDLTHIKETIARRYGHMTSIERAEILSMAVHNHLNKHLTGVDDAHRESLKLSILSSTFAKHRYTITRLSIFDAILDLTLEDSIKTDLATRWLAESAHLSVPSSTLENYVRQKRTLSEAIENQFVELDAVKIVQQPTYFDETASKSKKEPFKKRYNYTLVGVVTLLFVIIAIAYAYFGIIGIPKSSSKHSLILTSVLNTPDYMGISEIGRVYLIDGVEGHKEGNQVILTLNKTRYTFGLENKADIFNYMQFDYYAVKNYISFTRNGLIGSSEQFNQIIHQAYLNDIDPLLLFAIIGQEQAFVPVNSAESLKILNNPYNVFHSWMAYNTTLRDSTQIAINTIKNRLNNKPFSVSPFKWLNVTYAEDPNWHNGVRLIYAHLVALGRTSSIQ